MEVLILKELADYVKSIEDFPQKGVIFRDITSVLQDKDGLQLAIDKLIELIKDVDFDIVAGTESRGFLLGMPIAYKLNKGFVPIRKKGKLPREVVSREYDLEYGKAVIEIHKDAIKKGDRVLVIDDLIATGGTVEAAVQLIEELGGEVAKIIFLMELKGLNGREKLKGYDVDSVLKYDGE
jgi:adenine phosphoribosyltransferase